VHAADSPSDFTSFAEARGLDLDHIGSVDAVGLMCDWYEVRRADDVTMEDDGDMLLFQWGTYSWDGGAFSYDLTRQFIVNGEEDDDAIFQLSFTLLFDGAGEAASVGSGDRWCSRPEELADFRSFIASSVASAFASSRQPSGTRLMFDNAG
jgi:hypothetical protein